MFTHEKTGVVIHAPLGSTLIRATHRPQDLVPAFMSALKEAPEYEELMSSIPSSVWDNEDDEWWESEECSYLINEVLWEVLDSYAPDGYLFGCHLGDGSDFGYWEY